MLENNRGNERRFSSRKERSANSSKDDGNKKGKHANCGSGSTKKRKLMKDAEVQTERTVQQEEEILRSAESAVQENYTLRSALQAQHERLKELSAETGKLK